MINVKLISRAVKTFIFGKSKVITYTFLGYDSEIDQEFGKVNIIITTNRKIPDILDSIVMEIAKDFFTEYCQELDKEIDILINGDPNGRKPQEVITDHIRGVTNERIK